MAERAGPQWVRVIQSGSVVEVFRYARPVFWGYEGKGGRTVGQSGGVYRDKVLRRAREKIRRLINANFSNRSKFVTLTFRDNVTDLDRANREFTLFVQRMRRRYGRFKYVAVVEFQKRGAVHYHVMTDWPYVPKSQLASIWGQGFVKVNDIRHVDNVGAYMVKYMSKDLADPRLQGHKAYLVSRGLEQPRVLQGREARGLLRALERRKTVFSRRYTTEHQGTTIYEEYNLLRSDLDTSRDTQEDVSRT